MKLQLNKKNLKNLSKDAQILPSDMTPEIGGGASAYPVICQGPSLGCGTNPPPTDTCGGGSCGCDTSREECGTGRGDTNTCA